jgi:hypothetical protein
MDTLAKLWELIQPHWPFAAVVVILAVVGQFMKGVVWTRPNFLRWRMTTPNAVLWRVFWWGRKTMPLHPVCAGAVLGTIPGIPVGTGIDGRPATILYFAFAGVISTWAFAMIKGWAKREYDLDLQLPGESSPPPADGS